MSFYADDIKQCFHDNLPIEAVRYETVHHRQRRAPSLLLVHPCECQSRPAPSEVGEEGSLLQEHDRRQLLLKPFGLGIAHEYAEYGAVRYLHKISKREFRRTLRLSAFALLSIDIIPFYLYLGSLQLLLEGHSSIVCFRKILTARPYSLMGIKF